MIIYRINIKKFTLGLVAGLLLTGSVTTAAGQDVMPVWGRPVRTIVIDPGHGGFDQGAIGTEGTTEKAVTLALARLTAAQLMPRYRVLLTRTGDYQVDLADRVAMANHHRGDLLLSLHVGSGFSRQYSGVTIYYLNTMAAPGRREATFSATDIADGRLFIRWPEAHHAHHRLSGIFADLIARSCRKDLGSQGRVKSDRMALLQGADMPAVVVDIGCLNNPSWERQFRDPDRLAVLSDIICRAIDLFFQSDHPVAGNEDD